jgi:succinyl-diaminopimelate desuccinylase
MTNVDSIIELSRALISIPSQGGIDPPDRIVAAAGQWLADHGLEPSPLRTDEGEPVGVMVRLGSGDSPHYCLDACLDTAPFGDPGTWSDLPTGGAVRSGWLLGRGAADCKTAVALFSHLGVELSSRAADLAGTLTLLFDADEHTGRFGGVQAFAAAAKRPDGVMIGYPGLDEIVVGARGFWRAHLVVAGRSGHSGSRRAAAENAIVKSAALVDRLDRYQPPSSPDADFPLPPKITVTGIDGGQGYSIVPDRCTLSVDVRLTPRYDAAWADHFLRETCRLLDESIPSRQPTLVEPQGTWPAYRLPETSRLASSLRAGAQRALRRDVPLTVAGPSNIGNFLATLGIEATCGFGVAYRNLHGADEAIEVASIPVVYNAYLDAVRNLLAAPAAHRTG